MAAESNGVRVTTPATKLRYVVLAVGCGLALLAYVHRQSFVRAHPEIKQTLHLDDAEFGYIQTAFLIGYGIFQVPCGLIGDRFGARLLLTVLVFGWSLLTGLTAAADWLPSEGNWPFFFLLATRFLFGAFQAGFFPAWARVIADWTPISERATAQGMVWTWSRLGGVAGPFLFLWMYRATDAWTAPLWILGILGILLCVPFWRWFRNRPEDMPGVNAAERELIGTGRPSSADVWGATKVSEPIPWSALVGSLNVWALCLMYGCLGWAGNFTTNLLPLYLEGHRELSPETTTWVSTVPLAIGSVSCLAGGLLSDWLVRRLGNRKWGRRLNGVFALGLAGLALSAVPWTQHAWQLACLFGAAALFNDLVMGPAWAACADVGERYAGTVSGAMNMTGQFFGAVGMSIAGRMLRQRYDEALFVVLGSAYGIAALCWLAVDVTKPLRVAHNHGSNPV